MLFGKVVCIVKKCFFVMEKLQVNFNEKNLPITENVVLEYPNFGACTFKLSFENVSNTYNPRLHHLVEISTYNQGFLDTFFQVVRKPMSGLPSFCLPCRKSCNLFAYIRVWIKQLRC